MSAEKAIVILRPSTNSDEEYEVETVFGTRRFTRQAGTALHPERESLATLEQIPVRAARADGAEVIVAPFADRVGRDVIIEWPGGVPMQLYWHTSAPNYTIR